MDSKDVKVGMKVVPHTKTDLTSWSEWLNGGVDSSDFFKDHGFAYVNHTDGVSKFDLGSPSQSDGPNYGASFHASDFSPAEIEVGDTVRVRDWDDMARDAEKITGGDSIKGYRQIHFKGDGPVFSSCMKDLCGREFVVTGNDRGWISGLENANATITTDMLTLIRKAKKKEEPKMGNKPRLEDINTQMLVKIRGGKISVKLPHMCGDGLFGKSELTEGSGWSQIWGEPEIIAYKDMGSQSHALMALLRSDIPDEWDWVETPEPQYKVGDWVEVVWWDTKYHTPPHDKSLVGTKTQLVKVCANDRPYWIRCGDKTYCLTADELKPCAAPEPVVLNDTQLAEIKAKYGNGGDVLMPIGGRNVAI